MAKTQQENEGHLREYRDDIRQAVEVMNKGGHHSLPHRHHLGHWLRCHKPRGCETRIRHQTPKRR